ncbi:hypothetical protein DBV05_g9883 [Lasiodiplodia theobromae]|uniref:Non-reducing end beta-L-arabinofuranosidase-like GH127 catalytic domain-containing protein n=1 Tax=Lasiodiplodia theobromae TaxID=45133 RepID=A0A5N5D1K3_9PEZI|nr:hypothetical protein DBV05_g9883 [Lasiodiplodia theobromae]
MSSPALVPTKYELFPLGSIKAEGWMRNELRQCGEGLGGHLFYFYRFVKDSTWLGGTWEYSALNEAAPYWYNYIVPLAFSLDELADAHLAKRLRDQAEHFLQYTLSHQSSDGWLGPETTRQTRGIWARCLLLQGLMNHALADPEKRATIMDAMLRFVKLVEDMLQRDYEGYLPKDGDEFDKQWFGVARAHELSTTLQWLYDEPEATEYRSSIWHVMEMLWEGSRLAKRDWTEFFTEANFPQTPSVRHESSNFQHGVNVAQGLRYPAQLYRMHPSPQLLDLSKQAVERIFKFHGTPAGSLSSDEYIGGLSPERGAELCCTVELMFSLSYLHRLYGDNDFADRVEMAAFNFPAGIEDDWWSHQYITQTNQPWAQELELEEGEKTPWFDVCRYANVFGLEPEFIRVEKHADKSVSIFYGPLLYAYSIDYRREYKEPRNYKDQASTCPEMLDTGREIWGQRAHDEFLFPFWDWDIAIDPNQEIKAIFKQPWTDSSTKKDFHELPNPIWKPGAPPVSIEVTAVMVDWPVLNGTAAPPSAVDTSESALRSKPFRVKLQPFGAAKLHIAQFPTANLPEPV